MSGAWGKQSTARSCDALLTRVEANDPSLKELTILPLKSFGATELDRLSKALHNGKNHHLQTLRASGHTVPATSLAQLGTALAQKKSGLVHLAIGDEHMGNEGIVAFCQELESVDGGNIESLDFALKNISKEGMTALGRTFGRSACLTTLNLARNDQIQDDGLQALVQDDNTTADTRTRCWLPQLRALDLSNCGVTPAGVKSLAGGLLSTPRNHGISLHLDSNPLGPSASPALSTIMCGGGILQSLSVSHCSIGTEGLKVLADAVLKSSCLLKVLNLSHNDITTPGAQCWAQTLPSLTSLEELNLAGNSLEDEGVVALGKALSNHTLRNLDLSCVGCKNQGAVALLQCTHLETLRLFDNALGEEGFQALAGELLKQEDPSQLVNLDLGGNRAPQQAVAGLLRALATSKCLPHLKVLEIGGNDTGPLVEEAVTRLETARPELDIARDRPKLSQNPL